MSLHPAAFPSPSAHLPAVPSLQVPLWKEHLVCDYALYAFLVPDPFSYPLELLTCFEISLTFLLPLSRGAHFVLVGSAGSDLG